MDHDRCSRPVSKSKTRYVQLLKDRLDVDRRITMHGLCSELDMGCLRGSTRATER